MIEAAALLLACGGAWVVLKVLERRRAARPQPPAEAPRPPQDKSVLAALVLTLLFGPLGLAYLHRLDWALLWFLVAIVVSVITYGIAAPFLWFAFIAWGVVEANRQHQTFEEWKIAQLRGRP